MCLCFHIACCSALWDCCVVCTEETACISVSDVVFVMCNSHIVDSAKRNWHKWSWAWQKKQAHWELHKHRIGIQKTENNFLIFQIWSYTVNINILITLWQYNRFKLCKLLVNLFSSHKSLIDKTRERDMLCVPTNRNLKKRQCLFIHSHLFSVLVQLETNTGRCLNTKGTSNIVQFCFQVK